MSKDAAGSRLSDADVIGQGRSIIYQSGAPTDPTLIRQQLEILGEWVNRHRYLSPADWVELGVARRMIEELRVAID
ncbi:MAG TPA: hypothetical protein VLW53_16215 [Candidatus Eisenbacteria bacterium]|nr:hypothetical protein [Candidatus Eisenbacteria bacterium]